MTVQHERSANEQLGHEVMGADYIAHQQLTAAFGWQYSHHQNSELEWGFPKLETLQALKSRQYILLPTPSVYCDSRMIQGFSKDGSFGPADPAYMPGEILHAGHWMAFHKGLFPWSQNMTWNEQVALLASDEYVPNHPAATYALRVVLYIRGKELLRSDEALRTSSGDFHAPAALDATTELVMCTAKADEQDPNLGLAVAFKLPLR